MNLVTTHQIADKLGVKPDTIRQWRHRNLQFPDPVRRFENVPVWEWADVQEWAKATGREKT